MIADSSAVKEIERISKDSLIGTQRVVEVNGATFSTTPLHQVPQPKLAEPGALVVHTLTGLADYVRENRDQIDASACVIHVESPTRVSVRSKLLTPAQQRHTYLVADAYERMDFKFGQHYDLERFNIALQSQFEDAGGRPEVLRIAGTVRAENIQTRQDDGVTQKVVASEGIVAAVVEVPNPVRLLPFRTFAEVEQPASDFVFRLRQSGNEITAALFEADGGAWRTAAVQSVAEWIRGRSLGLAVIA